MTLVNPRKLSQNFPHFNRSYSYLSLIYYLDLKFDENSFINDVIE